MNKQEILLAWRDLLKAGAHITFSRTTYDARHDISGTWADVTHPDHPTPPIRFRPTHNCDSQMTARVDDVPHVLPLLAAIGVKFQTQPLSR